MALSRPFAEIIFSHDGLTERPVFRDPTSPWSMLNDVSRDIAHHKKARAASVLNFLSYPGDPYSANLLHKAVKERRPDIMKFFISRSRVNERDENGQTPLHIAAKNGDKMIFSKLSSKGADINARDNSGHTPLDLIRIHGHLNTFAELFGEYGNKE